MLQSVPITAIARPSAYIGNRLALLESRQWELLKFCLPQLGTTMKLPHRRQFLHLAAGGAALLAVSQIATTSTYVRIV